MDPCKVSAQFAAYLWFTGHKAGGSAAGDQAVRFARDNWVAFLPCAHEGIGRLLIRVAELDRATRARHGPSQAARGSRTRRTRLTAAR
jgi:hypothetical protein